MADKTTEAVNCRSVITDSGSNSDEEDEEEDDEGQAETSETNTPTDVPCQRHLEDREGLFPVHLILAAWRHPRCPPCPSTSNWHASAPQQLGVLQWEI